MSIQSLSCKAINYTTHDENDHYIKKNGTKHQLLSIQEKLNIINMVVAT